MNLNELTAEQIGKLFPIRVVSYNPEWKVLFEQEKALIAEVLGKEAVLDIEHIGSTSVVGLAAKPTIDILIETLRLDDELKLFITKKLETIGYGNMHNSNKENKMTFGKGYDEDYACKQTYHVHIREKDNLPQNEIYFRDYLRQNLDVRDEYANLKYALAKKYQFNREDYTQAKTEFINRVTRLQKEKEITLKPLLNEDISLFNKWLNKEYIYKRLCPDGEEQRKAWLDEVNNKGGKYNFLKHFIVYYNGRKIGYCLHADCFFLKDHEEGGQNFEGLYGDVPERNHTYEIGYFIGEEEYLNKGIGKITIQKLEEEIRSLGGREIAADPSEDNMLSVKALLSNGFKKKQDGDYRKTIMATDNKEIKAIIMALEKQALALWNDGNPDGFLDLSSDDVVYIDPAFSNKLEGKKALEDYYNTVRGKIKIDQYEMLNPTVQLSEDVAVLTYNYEVQRDGQIFRMNCTEVYKSDVSNQWKIIHTHWSFCSAQ